MAGVAVVLGLDDGDRGVVWIVVKEDVVSTAGPSAGDDLAANDDPPRRDVELLADLRGEIPARVLERGRDELRTDVAFGEGLLVHRGLLVAAGGMPDRPGL